MTNKERKSLEKEFNEKYKDRIKRIEEKNFWRSKKAEVRQMRKSEHKNLGITTTKLLTYYLFVLFNVVLIYALIAMWHFGDLSYLGVVISDIAGQILVFGIYSIRAYMDTKSEEDMKFKKMQLPSVIQDKIDTLLPSDDDCDDEEDNSDDSEEGMEG